MLSDSGASTTSGSDHGNGTGSGIEVPMRVVVLEGVPSVLSQSSALHLTFDRAHGSVSLSTPALLSVPRSSSPPSPSPPSEREEHFQFEGVLPSALSSSTAAAFMQPLADAAVRGQHVTLLYLAPDALSLGLDNAARRRQRKQGSPSANGASTKTPSAVYARNVKRLVSAFAKAVFYEHHEAPEEEDDELLVYLSLGTLQRQGRLVDLLAEEEEEEEQEEQEEEEVARLERDPQSRGGGFELVGLRRLAVVTALESKALVSQCWPADTADHTSVIEVTVETKRAGKLQRGRLTIVFSGQPHVLSSVSKLVSGGATYDESAHTKLLSIPLAGNCQTFPVVQIGELSARRWLPVAESLGELSTHMHPVEGAVQYLDKLADKGVVVRPGQGTEESAALEAHARDVRELLGEVVEEEEEEEEAVRGVTELLSPAPPHATVSRKSKSKATLVPRDDEAQERLREAVEWIEHLEQNNAELLEVARHREHELLGDVLRTHQLLELLMTEFDAACPGDHPSRNVLEQVRSAAAQLDQAAGSRGPPDWAQFDVTGSMEREGGTSSAKDVLKLSEEELRRELSVLDERHQVLDARLRERGVMNGGGGEDEQRVVQPWPVEEVEEAPKKKKKKRRKKKSHKRSKSGAPEVASPSARSPVRLPAEAWFGTYSDINVLVDSLREAVEKRKEERPLRQSLSQHEQLDRSLEMAGLLIDDL